jgi:hypothetical protein
MSFRRLFIPFALLVALVVPALASAAPRMEVAVQDEGVFVNTDNFYFGRDAAYTRARQLHARWLRSNVLWSRALSPGLAERKTAPKTATYDWSRWDAAIAQAKAHGIQVELTLTGPAPAWATANKKVGPYKPSAARFGSFVSAAVKHFRARGVYRFAIWNEPNLVSWLAPLSSGPKLYRALYAAGYKAATKASKSARVLIGETSPYALKGRSTAPLAFMRGVLCVNATYRKRTRSCPKFRADGFALHPYDARHSPTYRFPGKDNVTIGTLGRLTAATDRFQKLGALTPRGSRHMWIFLTEFGYLRYGQKKIPESRRATYLPQAFEIARKNPRVKQMLQYQLVQPPPKNYFWQSYLLTTNGVPTTTFNTLRAWAAKAAARKAITP